MRKYINTVLPNLFGGFLTKSILGRAQQKGFVEIQIHNLRDKLITREVSFGDFILSGCAPKKIREWELHQAMYRTYRLRPDFIDH